MMLVPDLPQRGRIHQARVALHQATESALIPALGVVPQPLGRLAHRQFDGLNPPKPRTEQNSAGTPGPRSRRPASPQSQKPVLYGTGAGAGARAGAGAGAGVSFPSRIAWILAELCWTASCFMLLPSRFT